MLRRLDLRPPEPLERLRPLPGHDPLPQGARGRALAPEPARIGLGRSRSRPVFCGSRSVSHSSGPSMAEEPADPLELLLRVVHQPGEENRQHVLESVGLQERLQLHAYRL